ncbi:phosphodiesterase YaeI [Anatilimnocola aggregata]|uniref:Phosphodiesterase YaeI n=1 Tax=Anatilimnocola aggregata TaxID=2528021 RepID=A0A517Y8F7_9BACT|nr:metallophosphoesterase [Anatilimnocola aggregata]QDU26503.1 phosphodiesterase YaeI [Anatilimnocola aggregata]
MFNIMHISDLHFGPFFVPKVAESVLKSAAALKPDIIVASGDFSQRAKAAEFAAARKFLDKLPPVPLIVCPGNHDVPLYRVWERIFTPHALYQEHITAKLNEVYQLPHATIVSLDSTSPLRAITNGRIDQAQLDFAREAFAAAPADAVRIVVAHHHFAPAPDYERSSVMPRAKRAIDVFNDLNVELILGGHLHRAYVGNSLDLYPGKDRKHGIVIVQSGTTTSRRGRAREREKNSFNWIRVTEDSIRITHYMYFDDAGGFAPFSRHIYPRADRQYFSEPVEADIKTDLFSR